ncbi:AraC family transcriptional regulator [Micromonospora gifhornensis]|nr:AraC family transcriptional regulator [Verrucosispora sp. FIM060022]RUL94585.1 AraC family transcriptional regulator [Verrucosispora sp. FIM060022]
MNIPSRSLYRYVTESPAEKGVERAIAVMYDNLADPVTIDDMARAAMFSKFHFARMFHRATGVSPGRFLSALRLQHAKRLLLDTSLYVSDISLQVGYNSVGTFSTRFTQHVGLSPTTFRRQQGFTPVIGTTAARGGRGQVHGEIRSPGSPPGLIFVGLFADRMPAGWPVRCTVLDRPGRFALTDVPDGDWYLLAHFVGTTDLDEAASHAYTGADGLAVGVYGPLRVRGRAVHAELGLRPMTLLDPPVLMALLDARKAAREVLARRAG